jgi:hypothetical protein
MLALEAALRGARDRRPATLDDLATSWRRPHRRA